MKNITLIASILALTLGATSGACAAEPTIVKVAIKDHQFAPSEIHVHAGQDVILSVTNMDATPEEFDSSALKVEKVIAGNGTGSIRLRRLAPGRFPFMGEYHEDTAKGVVIAE